MSLATLFFLTGPLTYALNESYFTFFVFSIMSCFPCCNTPKDYVVELFFFFWLVYLPNWDDFQNL